MPLVPRNVLEPVCGGSAFRLQLFSLILPEICEKGAFGKLIIVQLRESRLLDFYVHFRAIGAPIDYLR